MRPQSYGPSASGGAATAPLRSWSKGDRSPRSDLLRPVGTPVVAGRGGRSATRPSVATDPGRAAVALLTTQLSVLAGRPCADLEGGPERVGDRGDPPVDEVLGVGSGATRRSGTGDRCVGVCHLEQRAPAGGGRGRIAHDPADFVPVGPA